VADPVCAGGVIPDGFLRTSRCQVFPPGTRGCEVFSQVKRLYMKGDEGPVSLSVALAYADCFSGSGRFRHRSSRDRNTSGLKPITSASSRGFEYNR